MFNVNGTFSCLTLNHYATSLYPPRTTEARRNPKQCGRFIVYDCAILFLGIAFPINFLSFKCLVDFPERKDSELKSLTSSCI